MLIDRRKFVECPLSEQAVPGHASIVADEPGVNKPGGLWPWRKKNGRALGCGGRPGPPSVTRQIEVRGSVSAAQARARQRTFAWANKRFINAGLRAPGESNRWVDSRIGPDGSVATSTFPSPAGMTTSKRLASDYLAAQDDGVCRPANCPRDTTCCARSKRVRDDPALLRPPLRHEPGGSCMATLPIDKWIWIPLRRENLR